MVRQTSMFSNNKVIVSEHGHTMLVLFMFRFMNSYHGKLRTCMVLPWTYSSPIYSFMIIDFMHLLNCSKTLQIFLFFFQIHHSILSFSFQTYPIMASFCLYHLVILLAPIYLCFQNIFSCIQNLTLFLKSSSSNQEGYICIYYIHFCCQYFFFPFITHHNQC